MTDAEKIVHLTSVHRRDDTRIFFKECCAAVSGGYNVFLVVADSKPDEMTNGVTIFSVGAPKNRLIRMLVSSWKVGLKGLALNASIYHIHDPELLFVALLLKLRGKTVVYDAHEDLPEQIKGHYYIPNWSKPIISILVSKFLKIASKQVNGVVAATPYIRDQFKRLGVTSLDVSNFPMLAEIVNYSEDVPEKNQICYVGTIARVRGVVEIVEAMEFVRSDIRLALGGDVSNSEIEHDLRSSSQWSRVTELGFLNRAGLQRTLSQSIAGLVTLHPNVNYINAQPVKMFEYMAAGIPVIASDFPLWREIVMGSKCGLLVDPLNPRSIAAAINWLANNPSEAKEMGNNGKVAVIHRYNWTPEAKKLLDFYKILLRNSDQAYKPD